MFSASLRILTFPQSCPLTETLWSNFPWDGAAGFHSHGGTPKWFLKRWQIPTTDGWSTWWFIPLSKWVITLVISGHCPHLSHWNHQVYNPLTIRGMNHQVGLAPWLRKPSGFQWLPCLSSLHFLYFFKLLVQRYGGFRKVIAVPPPNHVFLMNRIFMDFPL